MSADDAQPVSLPYDLSKPPKEVMDFFEQGLFSEYHLAKARMAVANKDLKSAKEQVGASLCHNSFTPSETRRVHAEARKLRSEIKQLAKK
ncbi:MAG: hypothetical protein RLZ98_1719 [Pseudomonadota bacterium]